MHDSQLSKRAFVISIGLSLLIVFVIFFSKLTYNKTRIVFCDVGQGDGIYIRTENKLDIIIDAGPNRSMLTCLGKHMPLFDRHIELAFLTHPHIDHYGGFVDIFQRYRVDLFIAPSVDNDNHSYNHLKRLVEEESSRIVNPYSSQIITLGKGKSIKMIWAPSIRGLHEKNVLGAFQASQDLNAYSPVFIFQQNQFEAVFTGDATPEVLNNLVGKGLFTASGSIELLKIPHHGSKNGLTVEFLREINPDISILTFGAQNRYKHPSPEIMTMLKSLNKKYLSTAQEGDIVIEVGWSGLWRVLGKN